MSIRSKWCEFDKETRKHIKKRDENKCIICGKKGGLQIAHIFKNRSHGGRGCKENGTLLCVQCHQILDNPIGNQTSKSKGIKVYAMDYLQKKEGFVANDDFLRKLEYQKSKIIIQRELPKKEFDRCKDCIYLRRKQATNSTIPNYVCRLRKMRISKNSKVCKSFKKLNKGE